MNVLRRWAIRNPPTEQHERATCDVRTLPSPPHMAALYAGVIEVVPAEQLRGAVDAIRAARDAARTSGDMLTVRATLNEALDRFDRRLPTRGQ
jgi:hypothetical protein